jgi:hypothetical protein
VETLHGMTLAEAIEELQAVLPACANAELPAGADFHVREAFCRQ